MDFLSRFSFKLGKKPATEYPPNIVRILFHTIVVVVITMFV